jgi:hypothetical protein
LYARQDENCTIKITGLITKRMCKKKRRFNLK